MIIDYGGDEEAQSTEKLELNSILVLSQMDDLTVDSHLELSIDARNELSIEENN